VRGDEVNILIANDDGFKADGLAVLCSAAKQAYPDATIVCLCPKDPVGGLGLSVTPRDLDAFQVEKVASHVYVSDAKPADLIYLALGQPERFLPDGTFDLVLTGINHGENIGMDVFHSGTVGMAMLASTFFATPAIALSQQFDGRTVTSTGCQACTPFIISFLESNPLAASLCWNVNFPACSPRGWKICTVAHHSRFRPYKAGERRHERCDVVELENGFITVSPLSLSATHPAHHPSLATQKLLHWACELDNVRLAGFGKPKHSC
jgi:5'-nucleotidase